MSCTRLNNIDKLEKLTNLKHLTLGNNSIEDVTSITKLVNLETLSLSNNLIKDIGEIEI